MVIINGSKPVRINIIYDPSFTNVSTNVRQIIDFVDKSFVRNRVKYRLFEIKLNVESVKKAFSSVLNEKFVIAFVLTDHLEIWSNLTKNIKNGNKTPILSSIGSTAKISGRTPNIIRLMPPDEAHVNFFSDFLRSKVDSSDTVLISKNNSFGTHVVSLLEKQGLKYNKILYDDINKIILTDLINYNNLIITGDQPELVEKLWDNNRIRDIYLYDSNSFGTNENAKNHLYFSIWNGLLGFDNNFRSEFSQKFNQSYPNIKLVIYDLILADIIECLYQIGSNNLPIEKFIKLMEGHGKYTGSFSFNSLYDRDDHYFTVSKYDGSTINTTHIGKIINRYEQNKNTEYIVSTFNTKGKRVPLHIIIGNISQKWIGKVNDIYGNSYTINETEILNDISLTEQIYLENENYVCYINPSLDSEMESTILVYSRTLNTWSSKTFKNTLEEEQEFQIIDISVNSQNNFDYYIYTQEPLLLLSSDYSFERLAEDFDFTSYSKFHENFVKFESDMKSSSSIIVKRFYFIYNTLIRIISGDEDDNFNIIIYIKNLVTDDNFKDKNYLLSFRDFIQRNGQMIPSYNDIVVIIDRMIEKLNLLS